MKTALCNSMSDQRLQNLILLKSERDITDSVDWTYWLQNDS